MEFESRYLSDEIERLVENYLLENKMKSVVMGISGGLDSGLNAVIIHRVCTKIGIPFYGRFIQIESNKLDERYRAAMIGSSFCTDYAEVDLTPLYLDSLKYIEEDETSSESEYEKKIRRGNIKARLRMIYLYNLSQMHRGLVIDNDNMTEHLLGFFTLHGDVGDLTPLASFMKTEVYMLAQYYHDYVLIDETDKIALQSVIDCIPTDGLGITSSDVEQFGVKSYDEVDNILASYDYYYNNEVMRGLWPEQYDRLCDRYTKDSVDKVITRHKNSEFKRNHPYKVIISPVEK